MKKFAVVALLLLAIVPFYCGATWLVSNVAQQKETLLIEKMQQQSTNIIKIVSRKVDSHFFNASEDITVEINHPLLNALLTTESAGKPVNQFVIHNDIAYGPIPNFNSVGVAQIETSLLLTEAQRKLLIDAVGTDKPLRFFTTLGYFNKTRFEIISPPLEFHSHDEFAGSTWKGGNVLFTFSNDLDAIKFKGTAPGLVANGRGKSMLQVDNITLKGALRRKFEVLFTGEEMFTVANIAYSNPDAPDSNVVAKDLTYGFRSNADNQFLNINVIVDSGQMIVKNVNLKSAHMDFGFSHLEATSLVSLYHRYQQIKTQAWNELNNSKAVDHPVNIEESRKQIGNDVLSLLQHSPVFSLDNVGFATNDGAMKITGVVSIDRVTEDDILPELNYQSLASKVYAQADLSIDQSLIDRWPMADNATQMKNQIATLEAQGFITRKGKRVQSHLQYKEGKFTANGKVLS